MKTLRLVVLVMASPLGGGRRLCGKPGPPACGAGGDGARAVLAPGQAIA